ncbi:MAG: zinc dependent phospholipase C family protein [Candidatus Bathyarchaeia archaeon]
MRIRVIATVVLYLTLILSIDRLYAWGNGGYSSNPYEARYGTHDWVAEHALDWLLEEAKWWIAEYMNWYLYGTELPDNGQAPDGIGDTYLHHIYFDADGSLIDDSAARRANDTYHRALEYLLLGNLTAAAKYAGAMTHYIADMAVFGHVMGRGTVWGEEKHHSDYESYVNSKTSSYHSDFGAFLSFDGELRIISAYDAAVELAYDTTFDRLGRGLTCLWMDENYDWSKPLFVDRVGESLNLAVNYVADVLYTLYIDYKSRMQVTYVQVTFTAIGLDEDANGTVVRVDGVDYGYDDLPLTFGWILGSTHTYEWMEYVYSYEYGKRYVNHNPPYFNITVEEPGLICPVYHTEYAVYIANGDGGTTNPPPGLYWFDENSTITVTAIPSEGYVFEKWIDSTEYRENPLTVIIHSPLHLEPFFTEHFDFSMSVKPGEGAAKKGENVSIHVDVGLLRGAGNVTLSILDPPVGIYYTLSVKSGSPPLSSTLTVSIGRNAKPGVYDLTILAESRSVRRMAIYKLTILESEESWIQQNQLLIALLSISAIIIIAIVLLSRRRIRKMNPKESKKP